MREGQTRYKAKCTSSTLCKASTGTEQIAVQFTILEGERAGQRITDYWALTEAAMEYTLDKLKTAGWDSVDPTLEAGLGSVDVEIVVKEEEGTDGKLRERILFVNTIGVAVKNAMSAAEKNDFAARMRGALASHRAKHGIPAPARAPVGGNGGARPQNAGNAGPRRAGGAPPQDDAPFPGDNDRRGY